MLKFLIFVIINKKQGSDDFMIDYKTYSKFYNPDKERIYGGIKEQKKEIEQELKEMKKTDLKWRKKSDPKSQFVRQEALNDGSLEKRIIKSLNAFTPEELTNKLNGALIAGGSVKTINEIKNFKKEFDEGKLPYSGEKLKTEIREKKDDVFKNKKITISDDQAQKLVEQDVKKYMNFFENYEILDIHKEPEKGFTAFLVGNKKTGKVEIFVGGNDDGHATPEDALRTRSEQLNSNRAEKEIVPSQEAAVEYLKDIQKKALDGIKGESGKTYKVLDSVAGHSMGGYILLYGASNVKGIRCVVNDPGPVVKLGKYFNENDILVTVPNNGDGTYNKVQKIKGSLLTTLHQKVGKTEGEGEIKTSLLPALAVSKMDTFNIPHKKDKKGIDMTDHEPNAEKAGKELEAMQNYAKMIEPKLDEFIAKRSSNTNNEINVSNNKNGKIKTDLSFEIKKVTKEKLKTHQKETEKNNLKR